MARRTTRNAGGNQGRGSSWIRPDLRLALYIRDGRACVYCGATPPEAILTLDHWHARSEGGGNEPTNLVTACVSCNVQRGDGSELGVFLRWLRARGVSTRGLIQRVEKHLRAPFDRQAAKREIIEQRGHDCKRFDFTEAGKRARCEAHARRRAA